MKEKLLELLQNRDYSSAASLANKITDEELTYVLQTLDEEELSAFCRELDSELLADALLLAKKDLQEDVINVLPDDDLEKVFDEMSVDETVEIIADMPQEIVARIAETEEILQLLTERKFSVLKPLLSSMNAIDLAEVCNNIVFCLKIWRRKRLWKWTAT